MPRQFVVRESLHLARHYVTQLVWTVERSETRALINEEPYLSSPACEVLMLSKVGKVLKVEP